jgi:CRP-like cAMP-binding protein
MRAVSDVKSEPRPETPEAGQSERADQKGSIPLTLMSPPSSEAVLQALEPHAVRIPTRKGQRLVVVAGGPQETLYVIHTGVCTARAELPDSRRQILSLLYPGDFVRAAALPPIEGMEITAASEKGEVWRLRWPLVTRVLEDNPALARHVADRLADQTARLALHNAIVAGLSGDERVAALITELALRTGKAAPAGIVFDMPLSRIDIAEHLALNPDTVSRIMSRLRSRGLVALAGRHRLVCRDIAALQRECPLAPTLVRVHRQGPHTSS